MVVLFHAQLRLNEAFGASVGPAPAPHNLVDVAIAQGRFGVHLFFVISGFILGLPFAAERLAGARKVRLKAFYLRRLTRLEPPYIVALTLFLVLGATTNLWSLWTDYQDTLVHRFGSGLVYSHGLLFGGEHNPVLPPTWSLEVEIQFYLLAPALALVFAIRDVRVRRAVIIGAAGLAAFAQWWMLERVEVLPPTLLSYLQFFFVGFLLADIFLLDWGEQPVARRSWDAIGAIAWMIVFIGPPLVLGDRALWMYQLVILPILFAFAICATFRGPILRTILTRRWIALIGGMCYSVYLLHTPLMAVLAPHTRSLGGQAYGTVNVLVQFAVLGTFALLVSAIFFAFVERPCMEPAWPARLGARIRAVKGRLTPSGDVGAQVERTSVPG